MLAGGIRTDEDPVLPGREASKDFRFHALRPGKAQAGFHSGERIGREAGAFFDGDAHLIFPVEIVRRDRNQSKRERLFRTDAPPGSFLNRSPRARIAAEARLHAADSG